MKPTIPWWQVTTNILTLFSGTALARGLSAATSIVIARQIGPNSFGQYSSSIALIGLTTVLFSLGLDSWLLHHGGREQSDLGNKLASAVFLKLILGLVWLTGIMTIHSILNQSSFPRKLILLGSLTLWFEELARTILSAFKACLRNELTSVLMVGSQILFLGSSLWLSAHHVKTPEYYLMGRLIIAGINMVISLLLASRIMEIRLYTEELLPTLLTTWPFAVSLALSVVYGRADIVIIANKLGEGAAGIYGTATNLTRATYLIPVAIYGVMLPILSQSYINNMGKANRLSITFIFGMVILGLLIGGGLIYLSHYIVPLLYGVAYSNSIDIVKTLGGVLILRCPNIALAAILIAIGWQDRRIIAQAISAISNVLLNLLIVRSQGVIGVATVYVISEMILFTGYMSLFILWIIKKHQISTHTSC